MRLRFRVIGLMAVLMIGTIIAVTDLNHAVDDGSLSNNSSSAPSEEENAQEETAEAVAPDSLAGVDTALYLSWMFVIAIPVVMVLAAIIAILLVRWQRPPNGEY